MSDLALRVGYGSADSPAPAIRTAPFRPGFVQTSVSLAILIYLGSHAGFALRLPQSGIGFIWPPNAVLLAALVLLPVRSWIAAIAAALVGHATAHLQIGLPAGAVAVTFAANASQVLLAAGMMRGFAGPIPQLDDLRKVWIFVAAAVAAPVVASFVPALMYVQHGWAPEFWTAYRARVIGNVITTLVLAPAIFLAPAMILEFRQAPRRVVEFGGLVAALFVVHAVAFRWEFAATAGLPATLYLPLPVLLWAAVRFGPFGATTALTLVALQWMPDARDGVGPFAGQTPLANVVELQIFLLVAAVPLILLAATSEARQRSEAALLHGQERHRAMLTAIPDLMFLQSADGTYLDYHAQNPAQLLVAPESFLGKRTSDVLPPELAERFTAAFAEATDDRPAVVEYSLPMGDTERMYRARVVRCDGDKLLSIVQDITEREQAKGALHRAQMELARMSRVSALGELAATIAHEVDQPLCAIVANANACLRWLDAHNAGLADVREALADVVTDGNRASEVIRRTRELFRHGPAEKTAVDLNAVIQEVGALTRGRAERSSVACVLELEPDLPAVHGDRIQLQQVVFNLVTNALEAMRSVEHARRLTLRSWRDGDHVRVTVADTGRGLDPKLGGRIFEPFFSTKPDGLGMGLPLTRAIVLAHNGKVWASPARGSGAAFHVSLPVQAARG